MTRKATHNTGFALVGAQCEMLTFEQLINIGAGRQFSASKAHQRKAENVDCHVMTTLALQTDRQETNREYYT